MRVWIDITNSPHVLFFRPLIRFLEEDGHEVDVTARDFAQTLDLLELHGIAHRVVGPGHGGGGKLGKARAMAGRLPRLRRFAKRGRFDIVLAHGSHEAMLTARSLGIPGATSHDYEFATLQHQLGLRVRGWTSRPGAGLGPPVRGDLAQLPHRFAGVTVVDADVLRVAHGTGREVHVWTVDDPAVMAELLDAGVDGILTDRPDLLRDLLRARDHQGLRP